MFYGAKDKETACREIADCQSAASGRTRLSVGAFLTIKMFKVVDLTRPSVPEIPSIFDVENRLIRPGIQFLHRFVQDVARPISKDGAEHIEYVPTQVVTEYFKCVFRDVYDEPIKGILYSSSKNEGGVCCTFFMESDECGGDVTERLLLNPRTKYLRLDDGSIQHFDIQFRTEPQFIPVTLLSPRAQ